MPTSELLQVRAAARRLGVHENTLRRWEENGLIQAVRLPTGVRRFRFEDVERLRAEIYEPGSHTSAASAALREEALEETP
jgi:excisionase family DNA binding protein